VYINVRLIVQVWISWRKRPEILEKCIRQHDILLVGGIKNMLNMYIRVSSIPEVLANEPTCEFHAMNDAPLLPKEGIMKTLEDMLVVLFFSNPLTCTLGYRTLCSTTTLFLLANKESTFLVVTLYECPLVLSGLV
jgi:hypothetical protein